MGPIRDSRLCRPFLLHLCTNSQIHARVFLFGPRVIDLCLGQHRQKYVSDAGTEGVCLVHCTYLYKTHALTSHQRTTHQRTTHHAPRTASANHTPVESHFAPSPTTIAPHTTSATSAPRTTRHTRVAQASQPQIPLLTCLCAYPVLQASRGVSIIHADAGVMVFTRGRPIFGCEG